MYILLFIYLTKITFILNYVVLLTMLSVTKYFIFIIAILILINISIVPSATFRGNDLFVEGNVTGDELTARSPNSIFIGGRDFATISVSEITGVVNGENFSRITTTINTDFAILNSYNFTQILANINLNNRTNASSAISAVNNLFHGIGFVKFNANHTIDPEVGEIGNNFGSFRFFNRNDGNSTYTFSFFDEVIRLNDGSNVGVENETRVIKIENALQPNPFLTTFNFDVNINQSLNVSGNFTGNQFYGNMFLYEPLTPVTVTISSVNVPFNITGLSTTENNGFNFSSDSLIVQQAGLYEVKISISYTDTSNNRHVLTALINGQQQEQISCMASVSNSNNVESTSCIGVMRVEEGDIVTIGIIDISTPARDIQVHNTQITLLRIGD